MQSKLGTLWVVATPIGHLGDITYRAVETLRSVDLIAAEDTRHSQVLLQHFDINTPLTSLHQHNEQPVSERLLDRIATGCQVALISDAGTPLISDPGSRLVDQALSRSLPVVPIPGPCAATAALSVAGQAVATWLFVGFLPSRPAARRARLQSLQCQTDTMVFYEAPHRLQKTLVDMIACFGPDRRLTIAKELTKAHETVFRDNLLACQAWVDAMPKVLGEYVLVLSGCQTTIEVEYVSVLKELLPALPLKQAARLTARITGASRNEIYQFALQLQSKPEID